MNKIMYNILCIFTIVLTMFTFPLSAYANSKQTTLLDIELPSGGPNQYNGTNISTKGQAVLTETELRKRGYILVSTDAKEIDDYKLKILYDGNFWFSNNYLDKEQKWYWKFDKVYIYGELLNQYIDQYELLGKDEINPNLRSIISDSTVVLLYEIWHSEEKAGKISDEFNDNIPDYIQNTGYLEIDSSINAMVTLLEWNTKQYYVFYLSKGTPFMVRLPQGMYKVVDINTVGLGKYETSLPYHNKIVLTDEHKDRDNPYIVDITDVTNKYSIPEGDISGKPDLSLDKNQIIPEERTIVDATALEEAREKALKAAEEQEKQNEEKTDETKQGKDKNIKIIIIVAILSGIIVIWTSIDKIKEKIADGEVDEGNDDFEGE